MVIDDEQHTRCFVLLVVARRPTSIKTRNNNTSVLFSFKKHITDLRNALRTHSSNSRIVHLISCNQQEKATSKKNNKQKNTNFNPVD